MFIVPMGSITPLAGISQNKVSEAAKVSDDTASFTDIFKQALQNVEDTQATSQADSMKVALGEVDDLHTVAINLQKAQTAVDVFVSMKNSAIDAYKEVMAMSL